MIVGTLWGTAVSCQSPPKDETPTSSVIEAVATSPATAVPQPTTTATPPTTDVPPPPPQPTPQPTSSVVSRWQKVGGERTGLSVQMPLDWVNLSSSLDVSASTNLMGLNVMLLADSERTGRNLLAGKPLTEGAFGVGLITNQPLAANDPLTALTALVANQGTAVIPLTSAQPITATTTSGIAAGAMIDIGGDPLGFFNDNGETLRSRLLLFSPLPGLSMPDGRTATLFLLSAPAAQWERYTNAFDQMSHAIIVHESQTGYVLSAGAANVLGTLTETDPGKGNLVKGAKDVWTFIIDEPRYVTLSLAPEDKELDLSLTIISPSGQTVAQIDHGYAGDTEIAADILLIENGRYVVEVSDFFNQPGGYILGLALDDEPHSSNAGVIKPRQGIQSDLPVNAQHIWTFDGAAGQLISVVLTPQNNQMDAILNLYGPDGTRLVALDEGFSGDPEVISGFELPVTGQYALHVSSFSGVGGLYSLTLDEGNEAVENFFDAGDLVYGDVQEETLRSSEAHAWFFEGRANDIVRIAVRPLNDILDLDVWLFDPDIQRIAAQDAFTAGETEVIEMVLPRDGQFLILVREFLGEAGEYEIELTASPAAVPAYAGQLRYGSPISDTLPLGQVVFWQFNGDVDDVIDIELTPSNADTDLILSLQNPDGITLLELDTGGAGQSESTQAFTITSDGLWSIIVADFFNDASAYSLTVQRSR